MNTKGFILLSKGDPSVGIFPTEYSVYGDFHFDDEYEMRQFKMKLEILFQENIADDLKLMTFEEHDLLINE